jgi:hypothetical protein
LGCVARDDTDDDKEFVRPCCLGPPLGILEVVFVAAGSAIQSVLFQATHFPHALAIDVVLMFDVANPGAFIPDLEFVFAEFISARPACGIRDLFAERESI